MYEMAFCRFFFLLRLYGWSKANQGPLKANSANYLLAGTDERFVLVCCTYSSLHGKKMDLTPVLFYRYSVWEDNLLQKDNAKVISKLFTAHAFPQSIQNNLFERYWNPDYPGPWPPYNKSNHPHCSVTEA